jgi:hypothetical protein
MKLRTLERGRSPVDGTVRAKATPSFTGKAVLLGSLITCLSGVGCKKDEAPRKASALDEIAAKGGLRPGMRAEWGVGWTTMTGLKILSESDDRFTINLKNVTPLDSDYNELLQYHLRNITMAKSRVKELAARFEDDSNALRADLRREAKRVMASGRMSTGSCPVGSLPMPRDRRITLKDPDALTFEVGMIFKPKEPAEDVLVKGKFGDSFLLKVVGGSLDGLKVLLDSKVSLLSEFREKGMILVDVPYVIKRIEQDKEGGTVFSLSMDCSRLQKELLTTFEERKAPPTACSK